MTMQMRVCEHDDHSIRIGCDDARRWLRSPRRRASQSEVWSFARVRVLKLFTCYFNVNFYVFIHLVAKSSTSKHQLRFGGRLNFLGLRPPWPAAASPPPMLKPPLGGGLAPNGLAAGAVLAPKGFAATPPKAGAAALVLPKGFDPPITGAAGAPNAGVALAPPKGLAPVLAPKLELPPNGLADGAVLAGNALVAAPPNKDAPALVGDLLVSNGLIGSGVFGCSSAFGALPKTLVAGVVFTLNPPPNGFALAGLPASLLAPKTKPPPLLAATDAAGALAPKEKPPLAAPLLA